MEKNKEILKSIENIYDALNNFSRVMEDYEDKSVIDCDYPFDDYIDTISGKVWGWFGSVGQAMQEKVFAEYLDVKLEAVEGTEEIGKYMDGETLKEFLSFDTLGVDAMSLDELNAYFKSIGLKPIEKK